ncbi:MAG: S1 RNA-binding domain-containing protein [Lachnospiraceae bacterium]|nr:S1 RNA-binding domain-containing protein [Lachnospiraceae bacterium]
MLEIGTLQTLQVIKEREFGVYLAEPAVAGTEQEKGVLLPQKQVPAGTKLGDRLEVFLYRDSEDRMIATTTVPKVTLGNTAVLEVKEVSKIGAFLDMGLEKDLLLPFKEQTHPVRKGERCLIALYLDKSRRLAATMRVYPYLKNTPPYQAGDEVNGFVFEVNEANGAFVAVDAMYYGLLPRREQYAGFKVGQEVRVRVEKVRADGKLDLTSRGRAYSEIDSDAAHILQVIEEFDGCLPFNDKASPEVIAREFRLSKNAFKRAVGRLLKEGKIEITDKNIKITIQEETKS